MCAGYYAKQPKNPTFVKPLYLEHPISRSNGMLPRLFPLAVTNLFLPRTKFSVLY